MNLAGGQVGRYTFQPGWKWSECVKPAVGTDSCQVEHVGYCIAGKVHVSYADGIEADITAGEVYRIGPGHDAWVVGNEPMVSVEFQGGPTTPSPPDGRNPRTRRRRRRSRQARRALVSGDRLHTVGGAGNYVLLVDADGKQPKPLLQPVDEPGSGKNRMHVDIETPRVDGEVARLEMLGAGARRG